MNHALGPWAFRLADQEATAEFTCPECERVFFGKDTVLEHVLQRISVKEGHLLCPLCNKHFHSSDGAVTHIREKHPHRQDLTCPGCDERFVRLGTLIEHIEKNLCTRIDSSMVEDERARKVDFIKRLGIGLQRGSTFQFGPGKADPDFSRYMGFTIKSQEESDIELMAAQSAEKPPQKDNEHFPGFPTQAKTGEKSSPMAEQTTQWAQQKKLFPDAPPASRPSADLLNSMTEPSQTPADVLNLHDPDGPHFNAARYWDGILEKFKCPHKRCGKSMATASAFKSHLSSSAHSHVRYQCPSCLKYFNTAAALTMHSESQSRKCRIRDSNDYRQYLDQLTGGIADVHGRYFMDRTVKYGVQADVAVNYGWKRNERIERKYYEAGKAVADARRQQINGDYWF